MIYINITNSYTTGAKTGIQRVVRELGFRLSKCEDARLVVIVEACVYILADSDEIANFVMVKNFMPKEKLIFSDFKRGDIFFDIDASWGDAYDSLDLFESLKARGCLIVKMHYDAVPILYPQYSSTNTVFRYVENFSAAIKYVDYWICISQVVKNDLLKIVEKLKIGGVSAYVCGLGADMFQASTVVADETAYESIFSGNYVISVGTVEPRKNYDLVLDVFDAVSSNPEFCDLSFVIVGKSGWNNKSIVQRIKSHPKLGTRLHWFSSASDADLELLYARASVCLCLSHYEGFGLPAIEALARGVPVICTKNSAMEEVAKGSAVSVNLNVDEVLKAIKDEISSNSPKRKLDYKPESWEESAEHMVDILREISDGAMFKSLPEQAVYISIRPASLIRSILSIEKFIPFISSVVILTSDECYEVMVEMTASIRLTAVVLKESDLGLIDLPMDHQEKNTMLRRCLYSHAVIGENFLAFDDDCVVVAPVDYSCFIDAGRHKAYYFYDKGSEWLGAFPEPNSFDVGIWRTSHFLINHGYDCKLYNSHQPQIINKTMAAHIFNRSAGMGCDEWTVYFNMAKHLKPNWYVDELYMCAGWPPNFDSWLPSVIPKDVKFCNDSPIADEDFAERWVNDLVDAKTARNKNIVESARLIILEGEAFFTTDSLVSSAGVSLFLPISTNVQIDLLSYKFLNHNLHFQRNMIPAFIHVVLPMDLSVSFINVDVQITISGGRSLLAQLKIFIS